MHYGRIFSVLLLLAGFAGAADYVGSKACGSCHAAQAAGYGRNAMAHASGDLTALQLPPGQVRTRSGILYSIAETPEGLQLQYRRTLHDGRVISGSEALRYFIGSGAHGRGFVFAAGGQLFQSPIAFYGGARGWDVAPGFAGEDQIYLHRKVEQGCASCHASGLVYGTGEPFREADISCERCHGPGSDHIAAAKQGDLSARAKIVNPAKLTGEVRDSICAQCHLSGEMRVLQPGRSEVSYRPGERLADTVAIFVKTGGPDALKVIGHVEGLQASRCKREAGDQLWCGTCHDPHQPVAKAEAIAYYRAKCLTCHTDQSCKAPQAIRAPASDACTSCHMPTREVTDGQHTAFTDHRIRARPQQTSVGGGPLSLAAMWLGRASARDYLIAQAQVYSLQGNWQALAQLFPKLQTAAAGTSADAPLLAMLGSSADLRGDNKTAEDAYSRVLQSDPDNAVALSNLANHKLVDGDTATAIELWQRALQVNPGLEKVGLALAHAQQGAGQLDQARLTLERLLRLHPDSEAALALRQSLPAGELSASPRRSGAILGP